MLGLSYPFVLLDDCEEVQPALHGAKDSRCILSRFWLRTTRLGSPLSYICLQSLRDLRVVIGGL